ncbi:hypothetical protein GF380_01840 [Candidatus Uhrbacteria bacterium]|nr:hypothetical protein [Candidatus Uhrbacteria bacterium]
MTLAELIHAYCGETGAPFLATRPITPITGMNREYVGFYSPRIRDGRPGMGLIYIHPDFRQHGHATRAAEAFREKHPDMSWYAAEHDMISRHLAEKIGLTQQEDYEYNGITYLVYYA